MVEAIAAALLASAVLGALNAAYFVAVERRWMRPDPRWLPSVCRMDEQTCARVVDTPYARVFGVSNAALGLAWYGVVSAAALSGLAGGEVPARTLLVVVSAGTVVLAAYLIWALLARLHTACPLCFVGHGINAAILVLFLLA